MTLRKIATLLLGAGLTFGILGAGISASFSDSLSATENVQIGTLGCVIDSSTAGTIAAGGHSVTYDAPKIVNSAASSASFTFTVKATGDISTTLHLTQTTPAAPFTSLLASAPDVTLAPNTTHDYVVGLQWPELGPTDMGDSASITYTVACNEVVPPPPAQPDTYAYESTNAANLAKTPTQWANVTSVPGTGSVALTFTQPRAFYACFEYRTDGNVPEQRLNVDGTTVGVPPFAPSIASTYGISGVNDRYLHVCLSTAGSSQTVTLTGITYAEVRMSFGAESNERFGWTRFDAS